VIFVPKSERILLLTRYDQEGGTGIQGALTDGGGSVLIQGVPLATKTMI
jgi:hypothetical protein